jgi:hypothetical protein
MLFPRNVIKKLGNCAHWADRLIRAELIDGLIAGENDYTSNFTGALRREINSRAIPNFYAKSFVLKPSIERMVGADACIILANNMEFKICLFEAKWPRLKTHRNYWDSIQTATGNSHFHEQLIRQNTVARDLVIWEMFYCEYPFSTQPPFMPDHGSACVWHHDAYTASLGRPDHTKPWTDVELDNLLRPNQITIQQVIDDICNCRKGVIHRGNGYVQPLVEYGIPSEALLIRYTGEIDVIPPLVE